MAEEKEEKKRETLAQDLSWLRQKEGLTKGRLAQCSHIMRALGNPDIDTAYAAFVAAFDSLPQNNKVQALRYTLGIDTLKSPHHRIEELETLNNLIGRQNEAAVQFDGKSTTGGVNLTTIKNWETWALKELETVLKPVPSNIHTVTDPLTSPLEFVPISLTANITLHHGRLFHVGYWGMYRHIANPKDQYQLLKHSTSPAWGEGEFQKHPLCEQVVLRLDANELEGLFVDIWFNDPPVPQKVELHRFASLEAMSHGNGQSLGWSTVGRDDAHNRDAAAKFWDSDPPPGGAYYKVSWQY